MVRDRQRILRRQRWRQQKKQLLMALDRHQVVGCPKRLFRLPEKEE